MLYTHNLACADHCIYIMASPVTLIRAIVTALLILATSAAPTPDTAFSATEYLQQLFADQPEVV